MKKAAAFVRSKFRLGTASPFSNDLDESWSYDHELNLGEQETRAAANWTYLAPFFRSSGYYLYCWDPQKAIAVPPIIPGPAQTGEVYPYARRVYDKETDLEFYTICGFRVWPARDSEGREVILRLVSGPEPSQELAIYQRLNTPQARNDPRNHTLPVLKYFTFNGLTFVVVPRWQSTALHRLNPFNNVAEMLHLSEVLFEGLAFLHENRISHRDITDTNLVMNVIGRTPSDPSKIRMPDEVRYAYIDFGASLIFPEDTNLESVTADRELRDIHRLLKMPPGLCNPFKDDVRCLAWKLQRWTRAMESIVPEIGPFYDGILKNESHCPSAEQSLKELRRIRSNLTDFQLEHPRLAFFWENGRLQN